MVRQYRYIDFQDRKEISTRYLNGDRVADIADFEEITKNPETLGAFLRGLPVIEAPWDEAFQRKYCAGCGKVGCDDGSPCPYEDKRNNPLWWLSQESEGTQRA